jgi:hypothetical protein
MFEFAIEFATPAFVFTDERFAFPVAPPQAANMIADINTPSRLIQRISFLL